MGLDLGLYLFGKIFARMIIKCHVCTLAGKDLTNRGSYAARSARNKRTFSLKQKTQNDLSKMNKDFVIKRKG